MGVFKVDSAISSDLTNTMENFTVPSDTTDGAVDQPETTYENDKWQDYFGYYRDIPELKAVIDAKATWTLGKGYTADPLTTFFIDQIKGWGKDTFNSILENLIRDYQIGGDAFAEIIRDDEGALINLKPLDPDTIIIVSDRAGLIKRYEQKAKIKEKHKVNKIIKTEDMFHLALNRVADEIHGQSMVRALEQTILRMNEALTDYRQVMHRFVKPRWIFHLDTDDPTEIAAFKTKMDLANEDGENLYVPKDVITPELMATAPNATLSPLTWIESLKNQFYQVSGVPQIILGGSGEFTEASAKIAYLAFQQTIEEEQLFIEEQVGAQLGLEINLEFPASLENELLSDNKKDGAQNIDASETTAGQGQ